MEVTKPQGWKPFVSSDTKMLWLGLLARDTGTPASQRLQIRDEVVALSFDLAVSRRLFRFEVEKDEANRKFWMSLVCGSDVLDSEFIEGDKYADANTEVW